MSAIAIISLVAPFITFAVGHFHLLLPAPTPAVFPTTFGHGELARYISQAFIDAMSKIQAPTPVPTPTVTPPVDMQALLTQLLSLFEKQLVPPTTPTK